MTDRELMQQALEALQLVTDLTHHDDEVYAAIDVLRERLAQPDTDYWQEEARRYAQNADYWRSEAEKVRPVQEPVTMEDAIAAGDSVLMNEQAALLRECRAALDSLIVQKPTLAGLLCGSTTLGNLKAELHAYRPQGVFGTAPQPRQPLTDEQLEAMAEKYVTNCYFDTLKYARAIETAHGIGEKK